MTVSAKAPSKPFPARFTFRLLLGSTLNPINSSMLATDLADIAADFNVCRTRPERGPHLGALPLWL